MQAAKEYSEQLGVDACIKLFGDWHKFNVLHPPEKSRKRGREA